jgi:hypothetical protein
LISFPKKAARPNGTHGLAQNEENFPSTKLTANDEARKVTAFATGTAYFAVRASLWGVFGN